MAIQSVLEPVLGLPVMVTVTYANDVPAANEGDVLLISSNFVEV